MGLGIATGQRRAGAGPETDAAVSVPAHPASPTADLAKAVADLTGHVLTMKAQVPDPATATAGDVAKYTLDLWAAGQDCRDRLGQVQGLVD